MTTPNTQSKEAPQEQEEFAITPAVPAPAPAPATTEQQQLVVAVATTTPTPKEQHQPASACCKAYAAKLLLENLELKVKLLTRDQRIFRMEKTIHNFTEKEKRQRFGTAAERQRHEDALTQKADAITGIAEQDVPTQQEEESFKELPTTNFNDADEEQHQAFILDPGEGHQDTTSDDLDITSDRKRPASGDNEAQAHIAPSSTKRKRRKIIHTPGELSASDHHWNKRFDELIAYKEKFGDCHVPISGEYKPLGMWSDVQRYNHKHMMATGVRKGSMKDPKKIERLLSVGFTFIKQRRPGNNHYPFAERFRQLAVFKAKTGHCNVSITESSHADDEWPIGLGHFVADQRKYYNWIQAGAVGKNCPMTQDRIDQLNSIGFQWSLRKTKAKQDEQCSQDEAESSVSFL